MRVDTNSVVTDRLSANTAVSLFETFNASPRVRYESQDYSDIEAAYNGLEKYVTNVAASKLRGLIVSGPPGVGKTTGVVKMLKAHGVGKYTVVAGHMSVIQLYCELYRHRSQGDIVVLDDVDSAFKSMEGLNVVKAAADTVPQRRISWATSSQWLQLWGIPKAFDFDGGIILISNETSRKGRAGKLRQHINAIADRLHSVSLGSDDKDEQFHQLCYQVIHGDLLKSRGLTPDQECEVLDYIDCHLDSLDFVSLRTATKIAELIALEPQDWRSMANLGILNSIDHAGVN
ncbi:MAG: ATP-binding protein [Burkholderiaceae bacterium]|nr:ATP-binding protein [Burkholderiaceae bacterium]MCD8517628.1 ATP-binding protein [Burkholderiaceae bacterium]MCD8565580.1 ATP-binding protein [Burkholderiaceae bacterium]